MPKSKERVRRGGNGFIAGKLLKKTARDLYWNWLWSDFHHLSKRDTREVLSRGSSSVGASSSLVGNLKKRKPRGAILTRAQTSSPRKKKYRKGLGGEFLERGLTEPNRDRNSRKDVLERAQKERSVLEQAASGHCG